jgi:hypothetical protein
MKKDLVLLSAIAFVLALAINIAAARGWLPAPHARNPLVDWPARKCAWAFGIALGAAIISFVAIVISDRGLPRPSATLEWVYSSDEAARIVDEYGAKRGQAIRGVILDSVAFIPSYVLLIALGCFCLALHPPDSWTAWLVAFGCVDKRPRRAYSPRKQTDWSASTSTPACGAGRQAGQCKGAICVISVNCRI